MNGSCPEVVRNTRYAFGAGADVLATGSAVVERCAVVPGWRGPLADSCMARLVAIGRRLEEAERALRRVAFALDRVAHHLEDRAVSTAHAEAEAVFGFAEREFSGAACTLDQLAAHARAALPPLGAAEHVARDAIRVSESIAGKLAAGGLAVGHFLDGQTMRGWVNELGRKDGPDVPLPLGALKLGSTPEEARKAADEAGFRIPDDYVAQPSRNGRGWIFREAGTDGDANTFRVSGPDYWGRYPNGYVRVYNARGIAIDANGNELGSAGVGEGETHFELPPDVP